jgi:Ca2+-binding EF-hand superfamily protein
VQLLPIARSVVSRQAMSLAQFLKAVDADPPDPGILEAAEEFCKSKGLLTPASLNSLTETDIESSFRGGDFYVKSFLIRAARAGSATGAEKRQHMPSPPQMDMLPRPPPPEDATFLPDVNGGTPGAARAQDCWDTEQYLRHMLNILHENMLSEINGALAQVFEQSQRLASTSCKVGGAVIARPVLSEITPCTDDVITPPVSCAIPGQVDKEPEIEPDNSQLRKAATVGDFELKKRFFTTALRDREDDDDLVGTLFAKIDADGSGDVSKTEFIRAFKTDDVVIEFCNSHPPLKPLLNYKSFKMAFAAIDIDESDTISLDEFRKAIETMKELNAAEGVTDEATTAVVNRSAFKTELHGSALDEEIYDVTKFYKEEGLCQLIAQHEGFQNLTLGVIVLNALYIGIDVQHNLADNLFDAHWFFILSEFLFLVFFLFEICVRFGAFR